MLQDVLAHSFIIASYVTFDWTIIPVCSFCHLFLICWSLFQHVKSSRWKDFLFSAQYHHHSSSKPRQILFHTPIKISVSIINRYIMDVNVDALCICGVYCTSVPGRGIPSYVALLQVFPDLVWGSKYRGGHNCPACKALQGTRCLWFWIVNNLHLTFLVLQSQICFLRYNN